MTVALVVLLALLIVGAIPVWPHSKQWGLGPSGLVATILLVLLMLWAIGWLK